MNYILRHAIHLKYPYHQIAELKIKKKYSNSENVSQYSPLNGSYKAETKSLPSTNNITNIKIKGDITSAGGFFPGKGLCYYNSIVKQLYT